MRLTRWLAAVGLVFGLGVLQAAQRNALVLHGYAVGARMARAQAQENDIRRLSAEVAGLSSPAELARYADRKHLKFIAWTHTGPAPSGSSRLLRLAGGPEEPPE